MNDFQAILVSNEENQMNTFKELIESKNITIIVQKGSHCESVLKHVSKISQSIFFRSSK